MRLLSPILHSTVLALPLAGVLALLLYGVLTLPPWAPVSMLLTVFPFLLLACIGFYAIHLLVRRTRLAAIMLLSTLLLTVFWYARSIGPVRSEVSLHGVPISVMTWNVQRMGLFEKNEDSQANMAWALAVIQQEHPDLLILQEISHHQMVALRKKMDIAPEACDWTDYYGIGQPNFGGLAICILNDAEWKILQKKKLALPPLWKYLFVELRNENGLVVNLLGIHVAPPRMTEEKFKDIIQKAANLEMSAIVEARSLLKQYETQIHVQEDQIKKVIDMIKGFNDPTIIAGDFNSPPDLPLHNRMRYHLNDAWLAAGTGMGHTRLWGGFLPLRIDYIYVSRAFSVAASKTLEAGFSDHKPLLATVRLHLPPSGPRTEEPR